MSAVGYILCTTAILWSTGRSFQRLRFLALVSPFIWANGMLLLIFGLGPLYRLGRAPLDLGLAPPDNFDRADSVAFIGVACFLLGALWWRHANSKFGEATIDLRGEQQTRSDFITLAPSVQNTIIAIGLIYSILAFGIYILQVGGPTVFLAGRTRASASVVSSAYLTASPLVATAAVTAVIANARSVPLPRSVVRMSRLATVATFVMVLPSGSRRFLLPILLLPPMTMVVRHRRMATWKRVVLVAASLMILGSAMTLIRSAGYREEQGGMRAIAGSIARSPVSLVDRVLYGSDTEMRDFLSYQIDYVDEVAGYNYGVGLLEEAVFQPVPSLLFGEKPPTDKEDLLLELYGEGCFGSGGHCPDYSIVGSFYRMGGLLAVGLMMAALGWWLQSLDGPLRSGLTGPYRSQYLVAVAIFSAIFMRKGLMEPLLFVLYYYVPASVFTWGMRAPFRTRVRRIGRHLSELERV